ncbi:MAG: PKD domain-containing protein [Marinoscillum sp.]
MKQIIFIISAVFGLSCIVNAQGFLKNPNGDYLQVQDDDGSPTINLNTTHFISDFGLRRASGASKWHRGIDLNPVVGVGDRGHTIKSFSSGSIASIHGGGTYKLVAVDGPGGFNPGYGHIFRSASNRLGNFDLVYSSDFLTYVIIYLPGDIQNSYALTSFQGEALNLLSVNHEGVHYSINAGNLKNTIEYGDPLAPLGDSDAFYWEDGVKVWVPHLHLYNFVDPKNALTAGNGSIQEPDNCKDPLQYLSHDEPDYEIKVQGVTQRYNTSATTIEVWPTMIGEDMGATYDKNVLDIDEVRVLIRRENEGNADRKLIKGPNFDSRISDGSITTKERYPPGNQLLNYGSLTRTGYLPYAYKSSSDGYPRDNYYFADFVTRIHKLHNQGNAVGTNDLAKINEAARYGDGNYVLIPEVATVTPSVNYSSTPFKLTIDNFRPFVKKVIIKKVELEQPTSIIYAGEWYWDGTSNELEKVSYEAYSGNAELIITTSEPMESLDVYSDGSHLNIPTEVNAARDEWHFSITISSALPQTIGFEGRDVNNNPLDLEPSTIAVRTGSGANDWSPSGSTNPGRDLNHNFNQPCNPENIAPDKRGNPQLDGLSCDVAYVSIEASRRNPDPGEAVLFKLISGSYYSVEWNFGSNAVADNTSGVETTVVYLNQVGDGSEDVSVSIVFEEDEDPVVYEFQDFIEVGASSEPFTFDISRSGSGSIEVDEEVTFSLDASSLDGIIAADIISYEWSFGDGANYSAISGLSEEVTYSTTGNKTVRLTVCTTERCVTVSKPDFIYVSGYPNPIEAYFTCPNIGNGKTVDIPSSYSWGDGSFHKEYYWDFGDGSTSTESRGQHTYYAPGDYNIQLTICDKSGCSNYPETGTCTVTVTNFGFPSNSAIRFKINGMLKANLVTPGINAANGNTIIGAGIPLKLRDASIIDPSRTAERWVFQYGQLGNLTSYELNSSDEVLVIPTNNVEPGDSYILVYTVYLDNGEALSMYENIEYKIEPYGDGICDTKVLDLTLDQTCWNDSDRPSFSISTQSDVCPVGLISVSDWTAGVFLGNYNGNLTWPSNRKPNSFPYETEIKVELFADCGASNSYDCPVIASKKFLIKIDGSRNVGLTSGVTVCQGASIQIGTNPVSGFGYQWSGGNTSYLSSASIANPIFTALEGNQTYSLEITNLESGCSWSESVTVNVGNDETDFENISYTVKAGSSPFALGNPISGIGYDYQWSSSTHLSNDKAPNPVFTPPLTAGSFSYSVSASFRECAPSHPGQVTVTVENDPPSGLTVDNNFAGVMHLEWQDNSIEKRFVIQRRDGAGSWQTLDEVGSNVTSYTDAYCLDPFIEYDYRVRAYDLNNSPLSGNNGYSNTVWNKRIKLSYYQRWTSELEDVVGKKTSNSYYHDGALFFDDYGNEISLGAMAINDGEVGECCECSRNLLRVNIDMASGEVLDRISTSQQCVQNQDADGSAFLKAVGNELFTSHSGTSSRSFDVTMATQGIVEVVDHIDMLSSTIGPARIEGDVFAAVVNDSHQYTGDVLKACRFFIDQKDYIDRSEFVNITEPDYESYLHDIVKGGNYYFLVGADPSPNIVAYYDEVYVFEVRDDFSAVRNRKGVDGLSMHDIQGVSASSGIILAGTSYSRHLSDFYDQKVVAKRLNSSLNTVWTREYRIKNSETFLMKIESISPTEFALFMRSDDYPDEILMVVLNEDGNLIWESTIEYVNTSLIFDIKLEENNFFVASQASSSMVNITKYSTIPDLSQRISVCENVGEGDSYGKVGATIDIAENCESVVYASGSSSNFVATTSVTLHEGTWIKKGAYFSAVAVEEVSQGDCGPFGLPSSRITFAEATEFKPELQTENIYLVYPNPSIDYFTISIDLLEDSEIDLSLTDLMGKEVWGLDSTGDTLEEVVNTSQLSNGVYLLNIKTNTGIDKVVKVLVSSR